jgi:DNA-binding transcriptional MerR regulator
MKGADPMEKNADAFRTISEVADELDLPQHVLRFWETRFPQIKPLKRAGGRRFYRPHDVEFLRGVKHLLYGEGYTIRGVQKILKEQGARAVASVIPAAQKVALEPSPSAVESALAEGQAAQENEDDLPLFQSTLHQSAAAGTKPHEAPVASPAILETLQRILVDLQECEHILDAARGS